MRQRVLKVGLDFFGNREDAEDAAQDAMVQLWRYLEHIDAERNVEALAVKVAKNCCVSLYRKQNERLTLPKLTHMFSVIMRTVPRHKNNWRQRIPSGYCQRPSIC